MHPVFDADALLLLAIRLAAKRKPALLDEVVIALATVQAKLPSEANLLRSFSRLTSHGLLEARDGGYTLGAQAETLIQAVPKKKEAADQIIELKRALAGFDAEANQPAVPPEAGALTQAIAAWQASLPPLTKTEKFEQRRAEQGRPVSPRSRKPAGLRKRY